MPTPTEAALRALENVRDPSTIEWYAVPLLAGVFYVYTMEMRRARETGNWDAVLAGACLFGMDLINETVNGWIFHLTQRAPLWATPGPSALKLAVGWNFEIACMFAIAGIVFYHSFPRRPEGPLLARRADVWLVAAGYAAISVAVECVLNAGGHLVWEYPFWHRTPQGLPLIFLFGYFHFYAAVILVLSLRTMRARIAAIGSLYAVALVMNVLAFGVWGWRY